jgi:O-antigen/teichoic acid export membrane protein
MTAWLVAIVVAQSHDSLIAYRRAFGFGLAIELLAVGLTAAGVLVIGTGLTADHLIAISAGAAAVRAVMLSLRFGVLAPRKVVRRPDVAELRASVPFFALTFSGAIQSRVDLYAVAAVLPAAAVGEYALLTNFVLLVQSIGGALVAPLAPSLLRVGRTRVLLAAARLVALGVPLTLTGIGGTWLAMRMLYGVTLGTLPTAAAWLAMLPCYLYAPLVYLAFRDGRERFVVAVALGATAVSLAGTLLLAPALGIGGAMLAAALGQLTIAAAHAVGAVRAPLRSP